MDLKTLDHVALWVADRDPIADVLTNQLGMHVIDRTETFTLVGAEARRGKLTLFDAEGPRYAGALQHIALRVPSLEKALERVTGPVMKTRFDAHMELPEGLEIVLVEGETDVAVDLDHVAIAIARSRPLRPRRGRRSASTRAAGPGGRRAARGRRRLPRPAARRARSTRSDRCSTTLRSSSTRPTSGGRPRATRASRSPT